MPSSRPAQIDLGVFCLLTCIESNSLLSSRTIFFTRAALKFECGVHSIWEGFAPNTIGISYSAQVLRSAPLTHQEWLGLVEEYTRREITRPSDRLPAVESVVRRIAKAQGWSPRWGMWMDAEHVVQGLGWQSSRRGAWSDSRMLICNMNPAFYAPTWSWASIDGPVSYASVIVRGEADSADPQMYELEVGELDAASKVLTVTGLVVPGRLLCRIDGKLMDRSVGEKVASHDYNVLGVDVGVGKMSMAADVAVKPWSGVIDGEQVSTVVRVPYGEAWPQESWEGHCLCLRMATQKYNSLVLVLGRSRRIPGAWERIGLLSGANRLWFYRAEARAMRLA